jgi:hypothetical protein
MSWKTVKQQPVVKPSAPAAQARTHATIQSDKPAPHAAIERIVADARGG